MTQPCGCCSGMAGDSPDDRSDFPPPMGRNPDLNASSVLPIEKRALRVMVSDRVRTGKAIHPKAISYVHIVLLFDLSGFTIFLCIVTGTGQWATRASVIDMCDKVRISSH